MRLHLVLPVVLPVVLACGAVRSPGRAPQGPPLSVDDSLGVTAVNTVFAFTDPGAFSTSLTLHALQRRLPQATLGGRGPFGVLYRLPARPDSARLEFAFEWTTDELLRGDVEADAALASFTALWSTTDYTAFVKRAEALQNALRGTAAPPVCFDLSGESVSRAERLSHTAIWRGGGWLHVVDFSVSESGGVRTYVVQSSARSELRGRTVGVLTDHRSWDCVARLPKPA